MSLAEMRVMHSMEIQNRINIATIWTKPYLSPFQIVGNITDEERMDTEEGEGDRPSTSSQAGARQAMEKRTLNNPRLEFLPLEDCTQSGAITDIKAFKDRHFLYPVSKIVPWWLWILVRFILFFWDFFRRI